MKPNSKNAERSRYSLPKRILLGFVVCVCAAGLNGCFIYNKLKAKDSLNNGARHYNAGKFERAAAYFKEAMDLNPDLLQAKLFYATSLRSQVIGSDPESQKLAREAIKQYEEMVNGPISAKVSERDKDQAYAFIADLYSKLNETDSQKKWLEGRAKLPNQKPDIVAQCYYAIAVAFWESSHKITDKFVIPGSLPPKHKPVNEWDPKDKDEADKLVREGLKYINQALAADPNYANAYSYLNLFYREQIKMEPDAKKVADLTRQADEAIEKFQELNRRAASEAGG